MESLDLSIISESDNINENFLLSYDESRKEKIVIDLNEVYPISLIGINKLKFLFVKARNFDFLEGQELENDLAEFSIFIDNNPIQVCKGFFITTFDTNTSINSIEIQNQSPVKIKLEFLILGEI